MRHGVPLNQLYQAPHGYGTALQQMRIQRDTQPYRSQVLRAGTDGRARCACRLRGEWCDGQRKNLRGSEGLRGIRVRPAPSEEEHTQGETDDGTAGGQTAFER